MDCVIHNANYCITDNGNGNITEINVVVDEVSYTAIGIIFTSTGNYSIHHWIFLVMVMEPNGNYI